MRPVTFRALGPLLLVGLAAVAAAEQPPAPPLLKVFQLKHRRPEDAATAVRHLLSGDGSLLVQPRSAALTVRDREENLARIAEAIRVFDRPSELYRVSIQIIRATQMEKPAAIPEVIREVGARLRRLLTYNSFELVDSVVVEGSDGDAVLYQMGQEYSVGFALRRGASESAITLAEFALARKQTRKGGVRYRNLLTTNVNLRLNQTVVVGASRLEESRQAIILVLVAERRGPAASARPAREGN